MRNASKVWAKYRNWETVVVVVRINSWIALEYLWTIACGSNPLSFSCCAVSYPSATENWDDFEPNFFNMNNNSYMFFSFVQEISKLPK